MREIIYHIVKKFYNKAVYDVLIGYHFDKFRDQEVLEHHLVRLTSFWELQFTGNVTVPVDPSFRLLYTHLLLNLKPGELGRWIVLFHQTLDETEKEIDHQNIKLLSEEWKKRIQFFKERFESHPQMFKQNF